MLRLVWMLLKNEIMQFDRLIYRTFDCTVLQRDLNFSRSLADFFSLGLRRFLLDIVEDFISSPWYIFSNSKPFIVGI